MTRPALTLLVLVVITVACATPPPPEPSASDPAPGTEDPTATPSATASPGSSPSDEPGPGTSLDTPFTPEDILDAMRGSRRPGGVPDVLETEAIAAAVADAIWTFDGDAWETVSAGGSCGPSTCTLEIAGVPAGAVAEDLWVFEVDPATSDVRVADATLRGLAPAVVALAEGIASTKGAAPGPDALLVSARWLPPPDDGLVVLSYRTGAESGACGVDVTVDLPRLRVTDRASVAC